MLNKQSAFSPRMTLARDARSVLSAVGPKQMRKEKWRLQGVHQKRTQGWGGLLQSVCEFF